MILLSGFALGQEKLIKACFTQWYPYTYVENNKPVGLSIELYSAAVKRAGMRIAYTKRPWKRCKNEFARGQFDALVDGGPKIPNVLYVKKRPVPWIILFWVHNDSPLKKFPGYSQLNNKSVGQVRAYGYPKEFMKYTGFKKRDEVKDDLQGLKMLHKKRFELFIGDIVNNTQLVKKKNFNVRPIGPALDANYLTLCFSEKLSNEHNKFKAALNQMYEDGSIDKIYKKYFGLTYKDFVNKYKIEK